MADENNLCYLQAFHGKSLPMSSIHAEKPVLISCLLWHHQYWLTFPECYFMPSPGITQPFPKTQIHPPANGKQWGCRKQARAFTGMSFCRWCAPQEKPGCARACAHARAAALWGTLQHWQPRAGTRPACQHSINRLLLSLINICQTWREAQAAKFGCKIQRAQKLEMFTHRLFIYA